MPEKDLEKKNEEGAETPPSENGEQGAWADDIRKRGYYYDDSHGYENYEPDDDDADEE